MLSDRLQCYIVQLIRLIHVIIVLLADELHDACDRMMDVSSHLSLYSPASSDMRPASNEVRCRMKSGCSLSLCLAIAIALSLASLERFSPDTWRFDGVNTN